MLYKYKAKSRICQVLSRPDDEMMEEPEGYKGSDISCNGSTRGKGGAMAARSVSVQHKRSVVEKATSN
jgi:hypothetical protein